MNNLNNFEIVPNHAKPHKVAEKSFYEMVRDHVEQNCFTLIPSRSFDWGNYTNLQYKDGNVTISFPLPNKGKKIKEQVSSVYFGLEDPYAKQFPNGHWKFNFMEFSTLDRNTMFEKFKEHFDSAITAL